MVIKQGREVHEKIKKNLKLQGLDTEISKLYWEI